ncbi:MaoC family dehydratase [Gulosibacter molinativorax]|uniref:MaoC family dehydratase n=2 Tax=Gulosibacter molinativorax TaxID=256821 RepID=A0ABT7CAL5_9MICO|nr:MaoC family dehydratase [Gulosibacter molinativorax]
MNPELMGRRFELSEPYQVGREHVREFARAVFATNPIHTDLEAARNAGYADLVAPPTFTAVLQDRGLQLLLADPMVTFELKNIVHGDQKYEFMRPVVAGDLLTTELEVTKVIARGRVNMIQATTVIRDINGEIVVTSLATLVIGGEE